MGMRGIVKIVRMLQSTKNFDISNLLESYAS